MMLGKARGRIVIIAVMTRSHSDDGVSRRNPEKCRYLPRTFLLHCARS